jgi:CBS domain-containing protein
MLEEAIVVRVQDVMTDAVEGVAANSSAERAFDRMRAGRIHHLVVSDGRRVVGIFSDRDAGGPRGAALRQGRTVGELMTAAPVTVQPDTPVRKAANVMRGRGVTRPVVTSTRWTLKHRGPHRKVHAGTARW